MKCTIDHVVLGRCSPLVLPPPSLTFIRRSTSSHPLITCRAPSLKAMGFLPGALLASNTFPSGKKLLARIDRGTTHTKLEVSLFNGRL